MVKGNELEDVRNAAAGRWNHLIPKICVATINDDAKHGPCPKCGGKDRFRVFDDYPESGGMVCNQCGKFSDGFATVQWLNGVKFPEALSLVAAEVGIEVVKRGRREKEQPDAHLEFLPWPEPMAALWCLRKRPITPSAMLACGARFAVYRKRNQVFAFPVNGRTGSIVGWCLYHSTGKELPIFERGNKQPVGSVKIKVTTGSAAGWLGPAHSPADRFVWKVEGPSDMQALLSLGLPSGHTVVCNVFGAGEDPASNAWMLERFKGLTVYVVHDCDRPGQDGAIEVKSGAKSRPGWAPAIASVARECRNVVLPYEITESHGKDLRDWILDRQAEGLSNVEIYSRLLDLASRSTAIVGAKIETQEVDLEDLESESIDDPHRLARMNLEQYQASHKRHLKYWKETWYSWADGVYEEVSADHFETRLNGAIKSEFDRAWKREAAAYAAWVKSDKYDPAKDKGPPKARKVTASLTHNVVQATKSLCALKNGQKLHSWTDGSDRGFCVSVANGILNISKAISPDEPPISEILTPHSPDWFSTARLDFGFDEHARCPYWQWFLGDVFNGDEESITLLQKWFGYLLTPDNSLQKMLFIIGEPRSGKGTIVDIMHKLFGEANVATPTLNSLSREFSLQPLIGKTVAIIADARLSNRSDETTITERLLSISGNDPQDIARKYKDTLTGFRLQCRFTLFSNLIPKMRDASAAFLSRVVFLKMPNSYQGKEDFNVGRRLREELPGILNWAIVGRHMLNQDPRVRTPIMAQSLVQEMQSIISPVYTFINEACDIGAEHYCDTKELFSKWEEWCAENDIEHAGTSQAFGRKLRAIKPQIETVSVRLTIGHARQFRGIAPKEAGSF